MTESYFDKGMAAFESADYPNAIELLTKALRLSLGDLAEILLYRGMSYAYLGAYDKAMADFNGAIERNPYLADAYNERGNLLRMEEQWDLAFKDYTVALHLDKSHYAAYYNRALTFEQQKRYTEAEVDLNQSIELNPSIAPAYEARGRIRAALHDYNGAIADLERYLRMGGGREYDNHSETQSFIINLKMNRMLSKIIPARFLPGHQV